MTFEVHAEKINGVLIKFCSLNETIPSLKKPETYSLSTEDYGLYPLNLHGGMLQYSLTLSS
jgi:hypothetical protein